MKKLLLLIIGFIYILGPLLSSPAPAHAQSLEDLGLQGDELKYSLHTLTEDDLSLLPGGGSEWQAGDQILFITGADNPPQFNRSSAFILQKGTANSDPLNFVYAGGSAGEIIQVDKNNLGTGSYDGNEVTIRNSETAASFIQNADNVASEDAPDPNEPEASCSGMLLIGWALCPIIEGLYSAINSLFQAISKNFLAVDPLSDDPGSPDDPHVVIFNIWNNFRIIANVGFVIVFLIAIIGNAYGFLLDAYDFKKVVPRLGLAFIGVQLSWYICAFLIDFFNVLGAGVRSIMLAPVEGLQTIDLDFGSLGEIVGLLTAGGAAALIKFGIGIKGLLGMLPFVLLPIVLTILVTLFVLAVRQMLIFLLVVTSPLAFVAGILPGTDRGFKLWWDMFWRALMMYPLIVALIAMGELTAKLLVAGDQENTLYKIVGIIALFAPFFLIPFTFKVAGNLITNIASGFQRASHKMRERAFGDIRNEHSYRARQRSRRRIRSDQKSAEFIARQRQNMPTAWFGDEGIRKTAGRNYRRGGLRAAVGGVAGMAYTRIGPNIDEKIAAHTGRSWDWAKSVGEVDAAALMAQMGFTVNPFTKTAIDPRYINEAKPYLNDASRTTAAMGVLLTKAGSNEEVEAIRNQLVAQTQPRSGGRAPLMSHEQAHLAWDVAAHSVQSVHDDLKYRDWQTGRIMPEYVPEFIRKTADTQMSFNIENQRGGFWEGLQESYEILRTNPASVGTDAANKTNAETVARAKQKFNAVRGEVMRELSDSFVFRNRERVMEEIRRRHGPMLNAQNKSMELTDFMSSANRHYIDEALQAIAADPKYNAPSVQDLVINEAMGGRQTVGAFNEMKNFLKNTRQF